MIKIIQNLDTLVMNIIHLFGISGNHLMDQQIL